MADGTDGGRDRDGRNRDGRRLLPGAAAVLVAVYLTAGLLWFLPKPGYTTTRLAFFAVLAALGWLGAAGGVTGRPRLAFAGGVGLFLLGFWQAVLWLVVLPAAAGLLAVGAGIGRVDAAAGDH